MKLKVGLWGGHVDQTAGAGLALAVYVDPFWRTIIPVRSPLRARGLRPRRPTPAAVGQNRSTNSASDSISATAVVGSDTSRLCDRLIKTPSSPARVAASTSVARSPI